VRKTIVTCQVCKGKYEVYTRVDLRRYKCLYCIRAEVVAAPRTEGDNGKGGT
jgi:hypothetical protein